MRRARWGAVVAVVVARAAAAQGEPAGAPAPAPPAAGDLASACIDLLRGAPPPGEDPAALRPRCEALLRAGGTTAPGASTGSPGAGAEVRAAFEQAGRELVGQGGAPLGGAGASRTLLTTNPIGWFSGLGVNAELSRALDGAPRLSWIASARYARANASNGDVTTVGLGTGADLFAFGGRNEGLRVGPRVELSFGSEDVGSGTNSFARLGLSGELGYNFVASNGLGVLGAVGLGGRVAGDEQNENFASFTGGEFGPYLKLGLGLAF